MSNYLDDRGVSQMWSRTTALMADATSGLANLNQLEKLAEELKKENDRLDTRISEIDDKGYQTEEEVDAKINAKIGSAYRAGGTIQASNLTQDLLIEANEGKVYNLSTTFTTDANFIDGSGKQFPAGTDVAVIKTDDGPYKFNVISGFVDLSSYVEKTDLESKNYQTKEDVEGILEEKGYLTSASLAQYATKDELAQKADNTLASDDQNGLMSSADKTKLDSITFATDEEVEEMLKRVFGDE